MKILTLATFAIALQIGGVASAQGAARAVNPQLLERLQEMKDRLALTPEQVEQMRPVVEAELENVMALRDRYQAGPQNRRSRLTLARQLRAIQDATDQQLEAVLSMAQLDELKRLRDERREALRRRASPGARSPGSNRVTVQPESYSPDDPSTRDIQMGALTVEYQRRLQRPSLQPFAFGAMVSFHDMAGSIIPSGAAATSPRSADGTGLSASAFARFYPLQVAAFSLHLDVAAGVLWTSDAWPPGGTSTNGIYRFGVGFEQSLGREWGITAGLRYLHVSNGGGLVPSNPAYDAIGGHLGVGYRFGAPTSAALATRRSAMELSLEVESFPSTDEFFDAIDLHAVSAVYESHLGRSRVSLLGSAAFYYVSGEPRSDGTGHGMLNAGGVGQSLNGGVRFYLVNRGRVDLFVDAQAGGVIGGRFTRTWPFGDASEPAHSFVNPFSWTPVVRYTAGVKLRLPSSYALLAGYRRVHVDNFNRPDTPDFTGSGVVFGLSRRF